MSTSTRPPGQPTRATCERCGKTVWLRKAGTVGTSPWAAKDSVIFEWYARRGSKPHPRMCTGSERNRRVHHKVGFITLYIQPDGSEVVFRE